MNHRSLDGFGTRSTLEVAGRRLVFFDLNALQRNGVGNPSTLPISLKVLLENLLRREDGAAVSAFDIEALASWDPSAPPEREIAFMPSRVLLQDFTGVPLVVDLAVMRDAMSRMGGDPARINPLQSVDLIIDHSVQVDRFAAADAFEFNVNKEYERNRERYAFLRWARESFANFRVVPPGTGICHQVNLEYLADVVSSSEEGGARIAFPDTLVGTDSHTTMINALGVLGWGVGGIEAEAAMLGHPVSMPIPGVVGCRLRGEPAPGVTATDVVLSLTELLRAKGVVGKFVEYCGPGLDHLALADRATISNMSPEYGATMGFFPVDDETLRYLRFTGRDEMQVALVEAYTKAQGMFRSADAPEPEFADLVELDLSTVEPSIAGPKRPQDRIPLSSARTAFESVVSPADQKTAAVTFDGNDFTIRDGAVVIAAITSCTNTSNPFVMIGAGLLAKKAVEKGLASKPWVKTSLAPGSRVVTRYLEAAGLTPYLERLGFNLVGYGCTTCIGNSGPLPGPVAEAVKKSGLTVAAVLSGNRNFEGRINPLVRTNYLASPPLVVVYAIAGTMDIDLTTQPLGTDQDGRAVMLKDIWPTQKEIDDAVNGALAPGMFIEGYADVFTGDERWTSLPVPQGALYEWNPASTYIRPAPYFEDMSAEPAAIQPITGMRVLAMLGDSVTTDHISPAGAIQADGPAGEHLQSHGVAPRDFNSYGSRRGNHEVMMRGTFANIRLKNLLVPGVEGGYAIHPSCADPIPIFDAAMRYRDDRIPLLVIAGKEYGTGSSRDWAAKGTALLGVRAVLAESFERIHRSNLVGMGVLPVQFEPGTNARLLGLSGLETYDIDGMDDGMEPGARLTVRATADDGASRTFIAIARLDTPMEVAYYRNGGILQTVLRSLAAGSKGG
ncbi:MAG: aconitate hydratase AcnA [Deltaproteobacteria bacterium]|nr:aconitate hydratase AcnA [Deltaproteobacteria bacterium]